MSRHSRFVLATALVTLAFASADAQAAQRQDSIHFALDAHGAVTVPVTINGAGPFTFLVDTGSSRSSVSETVAARIAAPAVARTEVVTAAGRAMQTVVSLSRVALGGAVADTLLAVAVPAGVLAAAGPRIDGILGQDFFGRHNYTLDYRRRILTWDGDDEPGPEDGGTRLSLVGCDGRFLVELPQDAGRVVRFVPDSGADGLVIFTRPAFTGLDFEGARGPAALAGVTGSRDVTAAIVRELRVGEITLRNQPAVVVARPEADAPDGDGLLPLHHFARVSFRAAGYVMFHR